MKDDEAERIAKLLAARNVKRLTERQAEELVGLGDSLAAFEPRSNPMRDLYIAKYGSEAAADARLAEEARQDAIRAGKVSNAPEPARPMRGAGSSVTVEGRRVVLPKMAGGPVDWGMWGSMPTAMLWEAVALSLGNEPGENIAADAAYFGADYPKRLRIAEECLAAGKTLLLVSGVIGTPRATVSLPDFGTWAQALGWKLPPEFPLAAASATRKDETATQGADAWPWGVHETKLLRELAAAARHWWVNVDPSDNTTAPTNQAVSKWLQARGVGKAMAEKMATMLRADGLPTGPRT